MSLASTASNPLGYTGVNFYQNPPQIQFNRPPLVTDVYIAGTTCLETDVNPNVIWYTVGAGLWYLLPTGTSELSTLTGDTGGAISPVGGNINIVGGAGVSVAGSGNTLTIDVFGTIEGTVTTVGATTGDVITYPLGAAGVYSLDIFIEGFDAATPAGVAYAITGGIRTTGSAAVVIAAPMVDAFEEAALSAADVALVISGNSLQIAVTGVAGKTIVWKARLEFIRS